jgi:hypothetical protein
MKPLINACVWQLVLGKRKGLKAINVLQAECDNGIS